MSFNFKYINIIKLLILVFGIFINMEFPTKSMDQKKLTEEELIKKQRTSEKYLEKFNYNKVMVVGAGHSYQEYKYPENFYLVDSNRAFNVYPDLVADITQDFLLKEETKKLFEKFNVVVFEYVATDALTLQAFKNVFNVLNEEGILLFDTPLEHNVHIGNPLSTEGGKTHEGEFGKIITFFELGKIDVYVEKEKDSQKAILLILENIENKIKEAGFKSIKYIEDINKTEYSQYVMSDNKKYMPKFTLSAKKA